MNEPLIQPAVGAAQQRRPGLTQTAREYFAARKYGTVKMFMDYLQKSYGIECYYQQAYMALRGLTDSGFLRVIKRRADKIYILGSHNATFVNEEKRRRLDLMRSIGAMHKKNIRIKCERHPAYDFDNSVDNNERIGPDFSDEQEGNELPEGTEQSYASETQSSETLDLYRDALKKLFDE